MRELLVADRGTEVGEELQMLAQTEDRLLGPQRALELVVLPVADGAEQHRVGLAGELERGIGQGVAMRLVGRTADGGLLHLELQVERVEHLQRLGDDLGADAVAGQDCDLHESISLLAGPVRPAHCTTTWRPARASARAVPTRTRGSCRRGAA